jgi:serine/threonine-protein kinase
MRKTTRRTAVAGLGWLAAAVVATLIGMGGIRLIGDSLTSTPGGVLDQQAVAKALAASEPAPSAGPASSSGPASARPTSPSSSAPATQRAFSSAGGTVVAGCRGGQAYLVSWSPSPGYRVTQQESGPGEHVEVRFEGSGGRSEIRVACSGGNPVEQQHGGGHDN